MNKMTQKHSKSSKITPFLSIFASFLTILAIFSFFLQTSCAKSEQGCASPSPSTLSEDQQILDYCTTNKITYTKDSRGFYYQIIKPGNSNKPTLNSLISITYKGTYLNKSSFENGENSWKLSSLITGWQYSLPLIGEGGQILVILPSNLAYGSTGAGCIPPNTPLVFDINLSAVK